MRTCYICCRNTQRSSAVSAFSLRGSIPKKADDVILCLLVNLSITQSMSAAHHHWESHILSKPWVCRMIWISPTGAYLWYGVECPEGVGIARYGLSKLTMLNVLQIDLHYEELAVSPCPSPFTVGIPWSKVQHPILSRVRLTSIFEIEYAAADVRNSPYLSTIQIARATRLYL